MSQFMKHKKKKKKHDDRSVISGKKIKMKLKKTKKDKEVR